MILSRSGVHYFHLFQPVHRSGIQQLIEILYRHFCQFPVQNYGYARRSRKTDHAVIVGYPRQIPQRLKDVGHRFVPDNRREVYGHDAVFSPDLRLLSSDNHFLQCADRDGVCRRRLCGSGHP